MNEPIHRRVINFARGSWYPKGQQRLMGSILRDSHPAPAMSLFQNEEVDVGQPPHSEIPYAFKLGCFQRALAEGVDLVLWLDAACYAVRDITPVFDHIEKHGYFFVGASGEGEAHTIGKWTNDATLDAFGFERDEVMDVPQQSTCCVGLDLRRQDMRQWLHTWVTHRAFFKGRWDNKQLTESSDPRCLGHRHDQSVAALITHVMKLDVHPRDNHLFAYECCPNPQPTVCILSGGM